MYGAFAPIMEAVEDTRHTHEVETAVEKVTHVLEALARWGKQLEDEIENLKISSHSHDFDEA